MTTWLASFFRYACMSPASLRVLRGVYQTCGVFPEEQQAITVELAMRSWADFLAMRIHEPVCVWTARGGRS